MTVAKAVRFGAVVVVLAAYVFVFRAGETRIATQLDENARIAERVRAGTRLLASRRNLETERQRLRGALHAVELDAGGSALVARFLRDAARIGAEHRATLPTITATTTSALAPSGPAAQNAPAGLLESVPLEITVEGRYGDVLATMRALSRSRVLAEIDLASLARKHAGSTDATLTAALHVALQHLAPADLVSPTAPADVRARRT